MKNDPTLATRRFLDWMESHYPGSAQQIIRKAKVAPMAVAGLGPNGLHGHNGMHGIGPNGLGFIETLTSSGIPPLPTSGGQPTWSGQAVAQPTAVPQPQPAWYEKIADAAASVAQGYMSYKQQEQITDMQIERMKRGQPPIEDPGRYMAPTVKIAHDIDPEQLRRTLTPSKETQNLLLIGGGLIALVLLMTLGGGRRR